MTTTNYPRLPRIERFLMLDSAQNEDADLKTWPAIVAALVALMLGAVGAAAWLRYEAGAMPLKPALAIVGIALTLIFTLAWIVHRWQTTGNVKFNVEKSRRGFRVITKAKDEQ